MVRTVRYGGRIAVQFSSVHFIYLSDIVHSKSFVNNNTQEHVPNPLGFIQSLKRINAVCVTKVGKAKKKPTICIYKYLHIKYAQLTTLTLSVYTLLL